ncbi:MAG TPA: hypothetical protein VEA81_06960 [Burkholderiaceae bacterium]|nr:hypothetical protein [Burkholderiaceae bacterium]
MKRIHGWAAAIAVAVGLAGCGSSNDGGGGDAPAGPAAGGGAPAAAPSSVPASAFASVDGFVAYLRSLGTDDTGEPLQLGGTPPVEDVAPPVPLV